MKCTNPYLQEGYKLTDQTGATIAILINGEFVRWAASMWQPKSVRKKFKCLRAFHKARKSALLGRER